MDKDFTLEGFLSLVEEMRKLQKDYFASRAPSVLTRAKAKERDVDNYIKAFRKKDMPRQGSLFNG